MFQSNFGKTEAWFVIGGREIDGEKPYVLLGFKGESQGLIGRMYSRDKIIPAMLDCLHLVPIGFERMLDAFHYDTLPLDDMLAKWKKQPALLHQAEGGKQYSLISQSDTDRFTMDRIEVAGRY